MEVGGLMTYHAILPGPFHVVFKALFVEPNFTARSSASYDRLEASGEVVQVPSEAIEEQSGFGISGLKGLGRRLGSAACWLPLQRETLEESLQHTFRFWRSRE